MVRSVTYREPEWSMPDVVALVAAQQRRRLIGSHGQPMDEATSDDANPQRGSAQKWTYDVEPVTDFAKQAESRAIEAFKKAYGDDANLSDVIWVVTKRML